MPAFVYRFMLDVFSLWRCPSDCRQFIFVFDLGEGCISQGVVEALLNVWLHGGGSQIVRKTADQAGVVGLLPMTGCIYADQTK